MFDFGEDSAKNGIVRWVGHSVTIPVRPPLVERRFSGDSRMKIELAGNFPLSASGREFVTQQAERKLGRFEGRIREADITIDDVNGPKGGSDIRCLIRARLNRLPDVVIEETAGTVGAALHALDRAVQAVTRSIDKRRSLRRRSDPGQSLEPYVA